MRTLLRLASLTLLLGVFLSAGALTAVSRASADANITCKPSANPLSCACQSGTNQSAACSTPNDPIVGPHGVIKKVSLIIATFAGVAAVILIMVGGMMYVTAGEDANQAASGRRALIGAAAGLIIIVAAESILVFVVSKL